MTRSNVTYPVALIPPAFSKVSLQLKYTGNKNLILYFIIRIRDYPSVLQKQAFPLSVSEHIMFDFTLQI